MSNVYSFLTIHSRCLRWLVKDAAVARALISRSQNSVNIEILRHKMRHTAHSTSHLTPETSGLQHSHKHTPREIKTRHMMQILPRLVPYDDDSTTAGHLYP